MVDGTARERLVVRLAPMGVTRRGNTDVLRQVPLIKALGEHGVPTDASLSVDASAVQRPVTV